MKNSEIHSSETMSAKEIEALIALGKGPQVDYDAALTWVDLFIARAKDDPGKVAVADRDTHLTYAELDRRSDILAHVLIERGVQADDFVAVMLERTVRFPLAVLAIHKAGAAYVPIDLEYPAERVEYMLSDSAAKLVIDDKFISGVDFAIGDARPVNRATPDTLAYMIYTSGSTGLPKGAMVQHSSLRTLACTVSHQAALSSSDRLCAHPSFSFSAHIMDFYSSLSVGAEWHIVPEDIRKDLPALRDFIASHKITGGTFSTALGSLLLEEKNLATLRYVLLGGEKLKGVSHPEVTIINGYGCTECTCCTTYYTIEPGQKPADIPIGRPVPNAYSFIVDKQNHLVPQGDTGELCIVGPIVGKGYWNRDELTAESFIDCPFVEGRMYKTGDLARWNENGQLEFVGRMDTQVSLRGFRIELGEVESKAIAVGGIRQAVAEVKTVSGTDNLVLYYVPDGEPGISGDDLRKALEASSLAE
ncbi:MAG: amino acid adenylation domain-containing protein, partial [Bacteroidales bacterium]|nr:amino acid adenylation domain-containing protein [Bacteroidales bacterium]